MEIKDYIQTGKSNATDNRQLSNTLNIPQRQLARLIKAERLNGAPICATNGGKMGYYMPENVEELREYCGRLSHRAGEIFAVYRALVSTLHNWELSEGQQITIFDYVDSVEDEKEERTNTQ